MVELTHDVKIAVIGGSGLYQLDDLRVLEEVYPETPWGFPSDKIVICQMEGTGTKIAFLARHGRGHYLTPTEVPVQANIAALKHLGVEAILAFSAVGSLREDIPPCDFVLPDQLIDRTRGLRPSTYFGNGVVAHAGFADPFHQGIADIVYNQKDVLVDSVLHRNKTAVCMEGPAFSTRAESHMYRSWGADIINMSALPEAKLAREAEIAYQMVCMSTDYDCWRVNEESVTVETVMENMKHNGFNARRLLMAVLPELDNAIRNRLLLPNLKESMKFSGMTATEKRNPETVKKLEYILPGYFTL